MSTWPTESPTWSIECIKLRLDGTNRPIPKVNLKKIINKSKNFPIKFPITSTLCQNLIPTIGPKKIEKYVKSAYPVIHEYSLNLCAKFLLFKRNHGSQVEKNYYKNISFKDLIQRLLSKRAVTFMGEIDDYLLLDKTKNSGNWHIIGTNEEKFPLVLENCLSYDEIKLSALLSVSSYSYFINDGNRYNSGNVEKNRDNIQSEGIVIGLIGTRFEVEEKMEYEEIIVSARQNTEEKGYGDSSEPSLKKVFADFYEKPAFTFEDRRIHDSTRFMHFSDGLVFDTVAYEQRLALSFDTLIIEANHRARECNKSAYIHVVGIGLGVWKISANQTNIFMKTFGNRLRFLGPNLKNISDIHFAYISGATDCLGYKNGEVLPISNHPNNGIKIHISKREPNTKLSDEGKLLVVSYAWDGNALPGNEFWIGMLTSTGDSSTACSTQIAELHNPHINPLICADNLHVAMLDGTVKPVNNCRVTIQLY